MATQKRELAEGEIYHIYNRGANKKTIFHGESDYNRFLEKMLEYHDKFPVDILAYCLMPNHFHLLVRVPDIDFDPTGRRPVGSVDLFLHRLFTAYARYFGCKYADNHSGRVFEGTFKSKHVHDDSYFMTLCAYIHDNPVRKGLVAKPEEWPFSSFAYLINLRPNRLVCDAPELCDLSHREIYDEFVRDRVRSCDRLLGLI